MRLDNLLVWLHVTGNLLWVGAIVAIGLILLDTSAEQTDRGHWGIRIYDRLANPGFMLSLFAGMTRLMLDHEYYLVQTRWMHVKLAFALVAIVAHHTLGARARAMAKGQGTARRATSAQLALFTLSASAAVFVVIVVRSVAR